jgi:hypothetical protein
VPTGLDVDPPSTGVTDEVAVSGGDGDSTTRRKLREMGSYLQCQPDFFLARATWVR